MKKTLDTCVKNNLNSVQYSTVQYSTMLCENYMEMEVKSKTSIFNRKWGERYLISSLGGVL